MGKSALSGLIFLDRCPRGTRDWQRFHAAVADPDNSLLIYDKRLLKVSGEFRAFKKKFQRSYGVRSGEALKDAHRFLGHCGKLIALAGALSPRAMTVVAVGGGSVGDFAGVFASLYKRGVRLVHVPTTWLAAVDSAHGGKTALNWRGVKNQLGTFHPAEHVVLIRSLLATQPVERARDAMGELAKIALLDGGSWVKRLQRSHLKHGALLWKFLEPAIEAKLRIVARDPKENTGHRQLLNFGHTYGHVMESAYGWSHGRAVSQGMFHAIDLGVARGEMPVEKADRMIEMLESNFGLVREKPNRAISSKKFRDLLLQDKKRSDAGYVTFVFLKSMGRAKRTDVSVNELLAFARFHGWVLG
jgi:3-dehydroquinate synthase